MSHAVRATQLEACQERLGRNTVALAGGEFLARALGAVSAALVARAFGPQLFGQLTVALALVFYFLLLATFGLDVAGTRRVAALRHDPRAPKRPAGEVIGLRLLMGIVAFVLLLVPAAILPRTVALLFILYGLSCIVNAFLLDWYFIGTGRTARVAVARIVKHAVFFAGVLGVVFLCGQLFWVPIAWVGSDLAAVLVLAAAARRDPGRLGIVFHPRTWRRMLASGWSLAAAALLIAVVYRAGTLILATHAHNAEVGFYGAAFVLIMGAVMLVQAFGQALFPLMCRHFSRGDIDALRRTLSRGLAFATTAALPMTVLGILAATPVIEMIYGSRYLPAVGMFRVLLSAVFLIAVNTVLSRGLWAVGGEKRYLRIILFQGTLTVLVALLLVPRWGGIGAGLSLVAGELSGLVGYARSLSRTVALPSLRTHVPAVLGTAFAGATAELVLQLTSLTVWTVVPAAAAVYVLCLSLNTRLHRRTAVDDAPSPSLGASPVSRSRVA